MSSETFETLFECRRIECKLREAEIEMKHIDLSFSLSEAREHSQQVFETLESMK